MRINRIVLRNFRGYESKTFDFDEQLTVVVGNNTSGKTALLQAVQVALGGYLASLKSLPSDQAYKHNFSKDDVFKRFDEEKRDFFTNDETTRVEVTAKYPRTIKTEDGQYDYTEDTISWWREYRGGATTHSRACAAQLIDQVTLMEKRRETSGDNAIYPLVLAFGSNRIDNQYRAATKTKERASKIAKAYKSALRETVDFQGAFDWLYRYNQNINKGLEFEGTFDAFINALLAAIPALSDIIIDSKNNELIAKVSVRGQKPTYQTYDHMSDGFKSVICIVAEMAHRCIELNGFLGTEAVLKTPGIVLIDEFDLYLHPRWQQHLLADFRKAFPNIQFIVTTHSPFIIQSVRTKNLITLDGVNDNTDPIYRSIEEITLKEMNMETRRSQQYNQMLQKAEEYYQLVKAGKENTNVAQEVSQKLNEIEAEFSSDPAYVALLKAERGVL